MLNYRSVQFLQFLPRADFQSPKPGLILPNVTDMPAMQFRPVSAFLGAAGAVVCIRVLIWLVGGAGEQEAEQLEGLMVEEAWELESRVSEAHIHKES